VSVALRKLPGVASVQVSLNQGLATIELDPGNTLRLEQFWESVENNGFTPRQARLAARGRIGRSAAGRPRLDIGSEEGYELVVKDESSPLLAQLESAEGKMVLVKGLLPPPEGKKRPSTIALERLEIERQP
jgi:copper chaperone CopZ